MDKKVDQSITLEVKCGAVKDNLVKTVVTRSSFWMDASERKQKMRTGFETHPAGGLVLDIPVEGVKEGQSLSPDEFEEYMINNLRTLFGTIDVFIENSNSDF